MFGFSIPTPAFGCRSSCCEKVILEGKFQSTIISDVYSNDLASLEIALDELRWLRNEDAKRTVVLSDIIGSSWPEAKRNSELKCLAFPFQLQHLGVEVPAVRK